MNTKCRVIVLSALIATLLPCLQTASGAFELFPRPDAQYTVQRGDTLYGIAGLYYANPALWPFLWNQNPSVRMKDTVASPEIEPLKPGSKIDLYHDRFAYNMVNQGYLPPTGIPDQYRVLVTKIPLTGIPYDKKYFRFKLSRRPTRLWGYIVTAPETHREYYLDRDLVYVRFRPSKRQVILVGDRFGIYRDRGPLTHPLNLEKKIGHMAEVVGELEVVSTGHELTTAIILESYFEIKKGDKVCLFTPRRRQIVPTKTHRLLTGTVISSANRSSFAQATANFENDLVFIDRGKTEGMKEGILLNIYKPSHPVADPYFVERRLSIPDRYVGEGMILKAFEDNSMMIITRSREEVMPGYVIKSVSD